MQKARRHPFPLRGIGLRQLVSAWFQVLLTPLMGVLFIFQSPYLSTIGRDGVLSLGEWAPQLHTGFHEHRATLERQHKASVFAYRTITYYGGPFQTLQLKGWLVTFRGGGNRLQTGPTTPRRQRLPAYTA